MVERMKRRSCDWHCSGRIEVATLFSMHREVLFAETQRRCHFVDQLGVDFGDNH
jgi:hypothetical protein